MDISKLFLPLSLLDYFTVTKVEECCAVKTKSPYYNIYLEEKNKLPAGYEQTEYESKGFYEPKKIQDFPLRGRSVFLIVKRRRWRHKNKKGKDIKSDFSFIAEGSKLTKELSAFLK